MRMKRISVALFICQVFQDYGGWKVLFYDAMSDELGENAKWSNSICF